jgi:hypothetical protein
LGAGLLEAAVLSLMAILLSWRAMVWIRRSSILVCVSKRMLNTIVVPDIVNFLNSALGAGARDSCSACWKIEDKMAIWKLVSHSDSGWTEIDWGIIGTRNPA